MLVEDQYPSSDSDEGADAKEMLKKKQSKNILNKKLNEEEIIVDEEMILKLEEKERIKNKDAEALKKKRSQTMELFMDLDKNNDNYVDRKDLLKYYGMLTRIKGASVIPQYKCKQGHEMKIVVHDQNCNVDEDVKLGFTKED